LRFSINGTPKAAVLPVQVAACHMIFFLFAINKGITSAWIGEGILNPFFSNHSRVLEDNPKSLKVISVIEKNTL
jgi:hypothetical protein